MTSDMQGSCNCGAVKVTIKGGYGDSKGILCHCQYCRKAGGCASSFTFATADAKVVATGPLKTYRQTLGTSSGQAANRSFCGECGTPLFGRSEARPGLSFVKVALFDMAPPLVGELFFENAYEWEKRVVPQGS